MATFSLITTQTKELNDLGKLYYIIHTPKILDHFGILKYTIQLVDGMKLQPTSNPLVVASPVGTNQRSILQDGHQSIGYDHEDSHCGMDDHSWLVLYLPLRKKNESVGMMIANIWKVKNSCSKPPTSSIF